MILENIGTIISLGTALVALLGSVFYFRRARKAEVVAKELGVKSQEISTADEMIELVKKAHEEAVLLARDTAENNRKTAEENRAIAEERKTDNEKLRKTISKLERAIRGISVCAYRDQCPVTDRMQSDEGSEQRKP